MPMVFSKATCVPDFLKPKCLQFWSLKIRFNLIVCLITAQKTPKNQSLHISTTSHFHFMFNGGSSKQTNKQTPNEQSETRKFIHQQPYRRHCNIAPIF